MSSHEPSSEFVYRVVQAQGGPQAFYRRVYINSVCPLGFIIRNTQSRWVNYNYYDDLQLQGLATPFIVDTLQQQIALGCRTDKVIVMGKKNAEFLEKINKRHGFFGEIISVPHPRFVVQYRRRYMDDYVAEYGAALNG